MVGPQSFDSRKPVSSTYGHGLKEMFAPLRAPLPRKLEELVAQLEKVETERLQSKHLSRSHGEV